LLQIVVVVVVIIVVVVVVVGGGGRGEEGGRERGGREGVELFHSPTSMHNSLFINNMHVTILSSTCFEH